MNRLTIEWDLRVLERKGYVIRVKENGITKWKVLEEDITEADMNAVEIMISKFEGDV